MSLIFIGNNDITTLKTSGAGVCFGQCTFFAKISKEREVSKGDGSTIQSNATAAQALFQLDSGSYYSSRNRIFALHGLAAGNTVSTSISGAALAAELNTTYMGRIVFIDVTMPEGRHVVAAYLRSATALEFFDPNAGLYREGSFAAFSGVMAQNFATFNFEPAVSYYPVN
jgi:hypothetical protein